MEWLRPFVYTSLWQDIKKQRVVIPKKRLLYNDPITEHHCVFKKPKDYVYYLLGLDLARLRSLNHYSMELCYNCYNSTSLRTIDNEYTKRCDVCGYSSSSYAYSSEDTTRGVTNTHLPREVSTNVHKRVNHFKYWIKRIQGKERNNIKKEDLQKIREEMHTRHMSELDYESVRDILKTLGLQKYYNNSYSIIRSITGDTMVNLTQDQEAKLINMFVAIQEPFYANHKGYERVNMLSYTYIIMKLCEILGWEDLAEALPKLKSRFKIHQQDLIWKTICDKLHWKFTRSV